MDPRVVASHYDAVTACFDAPHATGTTNTEFNNWAKASLIRDAARVARGTRVPRKLLDLAGGRGGDIAKWVHEVPGVRVYLLLDISAAAVASAAARAGSILPPAVAHGFQGVVGDAAHPARSAALLAAAPYDLISCQFALNYLAPCGPPLVAVFERWYALAAHGGVLVVTYANWDALETPLADAPHTLRNVERVDGAVCDANTATRPDSYEFSLPPHVNALRECALTSAAVLAAAMVAGWHVVASYDAITQIPRNELWETFTSCGVVPSRAVFALAALYAGAVFVRSEDPRS